MLMTNEALPIDAATQALASAQGKWGGDLDGRRLVPLGSQLRDLIASPEGEPDGQRLWYVLLIEPQHEAKVAAHLTAHRLKVYMPTIARITTRGVRRTKVAVLDPLLRGYLFAHLNFTLDRRGLRHLKTAPGVHRFLQLDDTYATVPDYEMQRLQMNEEELAKPKPFQSIWSIGEVVRVTDGPFWGLNVTITGLVSSDRITVDVHLLGRAVPTTLDSDDIEKL